MTDTPTADRVPDEPSRRLLRAALSPPSQAVEAWQEWADGHDIDNTGPEEYRLLPLVSESLAHVEQPIPYGDVIKGIKRKTWVYNQRLLKAAATLHRSFDEHGMGHLLLKEACLAYAAYSSPALRPTHHIEFAVTAADIEQARRLANELGWRFQQRSGPRRPAADGRTVLHLRNADGANLDLFVDPVFDPADPGGSLGLGGERIAFPGWEVILLQVLESAMTYRAEPQLIWVADTHVCLRSPKPFVDADRFVDLAQRYRLVLTARLALEAADDVADLSPARALAERLSHVAPSPQEHARLSRVLSQPSGIAAYLRNARGTAVRLADRIRDRVTNTPVR